MRTETVATPPADVAAGPAAAASVDPPVADLWVPQPDMEDHYALQPDTGELGAPVTGPAPSSWRAVVDAEPWLPPVHAGLQPEQIRACPVSAKIVLAKLTRLTNQLNQEMEYAKQTIGTLMSIQIAQQQRHAAAEQELAQHRRRLEYHDLCMEIFRGNTIFLPTPVGDMDLSELPTLAATDVTATDASSILLTTSDDE